jgi:hypothetical protein
MKQQSRGRCGDGPPARQSSCGRTCKLQGYYITPPSAPSGALPTVLFIHGLV